MQKICRKYALFSRFFAIFDYFDLSQIFLEKCIFSAYFLHIFCISPIFGNFLWFLMKYAKNMHFSRGFFDFLKELATTKSAYAIVHIFCRVFAYIFQSAYFLHIAPCHQKRIAIEPVYIIGIRIGLGKIKSPNQKPNGVLSTEYEVLMWFQSLIIIIYCIISISY